MERIARKTTAWLIQYEAIAPEDRELYEYAIYTMLITIAPIVMAFIIGGVLGAFWEGLIMIMPFMCVRKFSGGYHAKNATVCMISSWLILVACVYLASQIEYGFWVSLLMGLAVLSLSINSPIDSENRRLDADEEKQYKKVTILISIICLLIHLLLLGFGLKQYAVCVAIGLILSAGLQVPCMIQKLCKKK